MCDRCDSRCNVEERQGSCSPVARQPGPRPYNNTDQLRTTSSRNYEHSVLLGSLLCIAVVFLVILRWFADHLRCFVQCFQPFFRLSVECLPFGFVQFAGIVSECIQFTVPRFENVAEEDDRLCKAILSCHPYSILFVKNEDILEKTISSIDGRNVLLTSKKSFKACCSLVSPVLNEGCRPNKRSVMSIHFFNWRSAFLKRSSLISTVSPPNFSISRVHDSSQSLV